MRVFGRAVQELLRLTDLKLLARLVSSSWYLFCLTLDFNSCSIPVKQRLFVSPGCPENVVKIAGTDLEYCVVFAEDMDGTWQQSTYFNLPG